MNANNYKNYINEKDSNGKFLINLESKVVISKIKFSRFFLFPGLTPLHLASRNGHSKVIQMLMHKGALTYKAFRTGNNPFHEASIRGFVNCVKIIFKTDPHVLNSANKDGVI